MEVGSFSASAVEERAAGPGWARAYEVARMASLPHLLHKEQWELKKLLVRIMCHVLRLLMFAMRVV